MERSKIVLQCSCHYTRTGLEYLINNTELSKNTELIESVSSFQQYEKNLIILSDVDIIILTLGPDDCNSTSILRLFTKRLLDSRPKMKILVIVGLHDQYNNVLTRYLAGLRNVCIIFDISTPLDVLLREITVLIKDHRIEKKVLPTVLFSTRESIIMQGILNGQSMNRISNYLNIDYKTVSHYKRSALGKFGIRSLQPLLSWGVIKNCPY